MLYVCHREKLKNGVSGVGVKKEFIMHALHLWYADYGKRCYISMFQKRSAFLSVTEKMRMSTTWCSLIQKPLTEADIWVGG